VAVAGAALVLLAAVAWWIARGTDTRPGSSSDGVVVQTVPADNLAIVLRSPTARLRTGHNAFTIEFRSATGALVDVGTVRGTANMSMPGMAMSGNLRVTPGREPGRYGATAEFGMAGSWRMGVEWSGPAGSGSVTFQGAVQ
jgi:hypothetical protein